MDDLERRRGLEERLEGEEASFAAVRSVDARGRVRESLGGVRGEALLAECEELARLGPLAGRLTLAPESRHDAQPERQRHYD